MKEYIKSAAIAADGDYSGVHFWNGRTLSNVIILASIACSLLVVTFKDSLTSCYPYRMDIRIRYIDDLFVIALYLIMVLDSIVSRKVDRGIRRMNFILAAVFLWSIFQTWYLHLSFFKNSPIFLLRDNIWYYPIFYFVVKYFSQYRELLLYGPIFFIWTQVLWYFMASAMHLAITGQPLIADAVQGTLGQGMANTLGFCLLLFFPLLYALKKRFLLIMSIIIFFSTSSRSAIVLLVFFTAVMILIRTNLKKKIIFSIIAFVTCFPPIYLYNTYTTNDLNLIGMYREQTVDLKSGARGASRINFFLYSLQKIRNPTDFIIGRGIGTYSSRTGYRMKGYLYQDYESDFPFKNSFVIAGSTLNHWLVEYGIVTTFLIVLITAGGIVLIRKNPFAVLVYLVGLGGLAQGKLMEFYGFAFFWFYLLGIYYGMIKQDTTKYAAPA